MDSFPSNNSSPLELPSSSNGRVSGKSWKTARSATVRSRLSDGVKTKSWAARMEQTKRSLAIKKVEKELKDEKVAEVTREVTLERRRAAEEKHRLEEDKAKACFLVPKVF
ncbi:hypothetical protein F5876DRAFT_71557 [Lentinula aff. lateritia]|uniref:Uncharacterized protein n=1 Tax=Lentinula aff. lateritia TaxID=2804960 RepID=A0ACC1UH30_9AGAR|nr:hypothetical protein F5876DRAFT_71557 [Lentinula aff. lateritia]